MMVLRVSVKGGQTVDELEVEGIGKGRRAGAVTVCGES